MAADVKAPRFNRSTTNMQDAAAAARARDAAQTRGPVDPNLIDNALSDLEVAKVFIDAADNNADELNEWFRPGGFSPHSGLHGEVGKIQTLLHEAVCRIDAASEKRLKPACDQAYAAFRAQRETVRTVEGRAYRFNEAFIPYRDAWNRGVATYLLNVPEADSPDYDAFEELMDPLYTAARDAAIEALLTPAATKTDYLLKLEIIDQQEMQHASDGELIRSIMQQLVADGLELAGGVA